MKITDQVAREICESHARQSLEYRGERELGGAEVPKDVPDAVLVIASLLSFAGSLSVRCATIERINAIIEWAERLDKAQRRMNQLAEELKRSSKCWG